ANVRGEELKVTTSPLVGFAAGAAAAAGADEKCECSAGADKGWRPGCSSVRARRRRTFQYTRCGTKEFDAEGLATTTGAAASTDTDVPDRCAITTPIPPPRTAESSSQRTTRSGTSIESVFGAASPPSFGGFPPCQGSQDGRKSQDSGLGGRSDAARDGDALGP